MENVPEFPSKLVETLQNSSVVVGFITKILTS